MASERRTKAKVILPAGQVLCIEQLHQQDKSYLTVNFFLPVRQILLLCTDTVVQTVS